MTSGVDLVAFAPHPDDAETSCGGLLAKLAGRGARVAICDLTRGELGSNGSPEERAREAAAAAEVLGLCARFQLGLPDGGLDARDRGQVDAVVRWLRQHRPRLVVVPHPHSRHPDHAEATELLRRAHFYSAVRRRLADAPAVRRPVLLQALDYHAMQPSFVVDISGEIDRKLEALRCYRSQFERRPGDVATLLNDPAYLERVVTQARTYGQLIGCAAGEPFTVEGAVPVDDPLAHFAPPVEDGA